MSCDIGEVTESLENELCYDCNYELCSFSKLCHFTYVTAHSESRSFPSLHLCHSSFSNPPLALPTSQLILQPFCCFTYITAHSPTLLSPLLRHRIFTYITWRAAHDSSSPYRCLIHGHLDCKSYKGKRSIINKKKKRKAKCY